MRRATIACQSHRARFHQPDHLGQVVEVSGRVLRLRRCPSRTQAVAARHFMNWPLKLGHCCLRIVVATIPQKIRRQTEIVGPGPIPIHDPT